jgi:hypothetical protein
MADLGRAVSKSGAELGAGPCRNDGVERRRHARRRSMEKPMLIEAKNRERQKMFILRVK